MAHIKHPASSRLVPRSVHHRTFPSSTRHLEDVRRFVEACAAAAALAEETIEQVKLAVDEACTNVIEHAYEGDGARQIGVAVIVEPHRCTVRIRDDGQAFRPGEYRAPDLREAVKQRRPGGFGVQIMNRLMDRVEYRTRGKINEVCLTKLLKCETA